MEDMMPIIDERSETLEKNLDDAWEELKRSSEKVAFPLIDRLEAELARVAREIKAKPGPSEIYALSELRAKAMGGAGQPEHGEEGGSQGENTADEGDVMEDEAGENPDDEDEEAED
ncbi:hypothetical protein Pmar_PMAR021832 [Perkinsus marinus ATCC 50983]|uniref:Uncharacterized protein n=1 Tax=Perkinsus marinus (strain ATCC 50983 / TXsc) TaxID=423536 RepID=C5LG70_PERM5|nr:hypothetical protein Pmar_PMAR021832 [Perkinsus marinus ATCC 50983]EER04325.1 hypothetical protein Pmar_PMAR021832 [Perkinsus marinus ATCC 50983]|eukprot:XP_002772509.1 hypothetical protein Pmar_PMAR021832 [Perkinsus marinus ATCC 50983]